MTAAFWALTLVVTVNALLFHLLPRFSRPDILFGVTVPEAFVAGAGRMLMGAAHRGVDAQVQVIAPLASAWRDLSSREQRNASQPWPARTGPTTRPRLVRVRTK